MAVNSSTANLLVFADPLFLMIEKSVGWGLSVP